MTLKVFSRLFLSALIAFVSYAGWAYYANSLVTDNVDILRKAAFVQGAYSGAITLFFTILLELFYKKFGATAYCLPFIIPSINSVPSAQTKCPTQETFSASLALSERVCNGTCLPRKFVSPLPALLIQAVLVISVNIAFKTPNLWLTVAPSIIFSAIYGYVYSMALARKK